MLVLWTYEIRDTVFWAVTGALDIALLFWLRRTSVRSQADPRRPDRRPDSDARSAVSDDRSEFGGDPPGARQSTSVNQPERGAR